MPGSRASSSYWKAGRPTRKGPGDGPLEYPVHAGVDRCIAGRFLRPADRVSKRERPPWPQRRQQYSDAADLQRQRAGVCSDSAAVCGPVVCLLLDAVHRRAWCQSSLLVAAEPALDEAQAPAPAQSGPFRRDDQPASGNRSGANDRCVRRPPCGDALSGRRTVVSRRRDGRVRRADLQDVAGRHGTRPSQGRPPTADRRPAQIFARRTARTPRCSRS